MYRGKVEFTASMWWVIAMLITFTIGGMTGVMLSIPANDFVLHNSMFLVAHFHNVIIGGAVYGYFAGMTYWYPKATGLILNEKLGKLACALWFVGFFLAWMPMYLTGFDGMTRRLNYVDNPDWAPYFYVAMLGVLFIALGTAALVGNIVLSIWKRNDPEYQDTTGDPWNARTLEWATSSPPAFYNFGHVSHIDDRDPLLDMKRKGTAYKAPSKYERIHMPKNTWAGVFIGGFSTVMGFALVWHIWWMAILGFAGIILSWIAYSFVRDKDYYVEVSEIEAIEAKFLERNANREF